MVLSARSESLIYKLNNLLPNRFLQSHWYLLGTRTCQMGERRVALTQQSFMFHLKALKIVSPQLCRKKPPRDGLMEADPI